MILLNLFFYFLNFLLLDKEPTNYLIKSEKVYSFKKPIINFPSSGFKQIISIDGVENIAFLNNSNYKIYLYKLDSQLLIDSINLYTDTAIYKSIVERVISTPTDTFSFKPKISAFYIKNLDSIFVLPQFENVLYLVNNNGKVLNEWNIDNSNLSIPSFSLYGFQTDPLFIRNNKIYLTGMGAAVPEIWHSSNPVIEYDLVERKITSMAGSYPSTYLKNKWWFTIGSEISKTVNKNGQIIVSYPTSAEIRIFEQEKLKNKISVESEFLKNYKFAYFDTSRRDELAYKIEYANSLGRYGQIIYDFYRNIYYRVIEHPQKFKNKNGSKNFTQDRKFSIQLIDADFNLISEEEFPAKFYEFSSILISKEGLLISNNNELNPENRDGTFSYSLFKIKLK